ncbi:glycosyltransferase [Roseovarius aquimarinus]|uniref:Glycosyltransferase n=1 Tax=Roseovarius aquimarinus TaxID=1229156 RepID=A0ABW7I3U9_9RHOB
MTTNASPSVLVIVLNYRTPELSLRAAEAALGAMEGIAGRIVIVDNASGDASARIIGEGIAARGWDRVTLLQSPRNGGFGAGNNFGMRAAASLPGGAAHDFVYILNSDAQPRPDALRALLAALEADPSAGMAGSRTIGEDGVLHRTAFRFPSILGEFEGAVRTGIFTRLLRDWVVPLPVPEETARVDWVAGASLLLRARMLEEVGLFDEAFFLYYEETDLSLRAARAGWTCLYVPASEVMHIGSVSTGMRAWARTPSYWFDSRLHYFVQNHGRAYAVAATLSRAAGEALWRLRCLLTGRARRDPPRFLRDLLAHGLRRVWACRSRRVIRPSRAALAKGANP